MKFIQQMDRNSNFSTQQNNTIFSSILHVKFEYEKIT